MDPEYVTIVLFISTTKWSIKAISIDRRTPPNTNLTVYIIYNLQLNDHLRPLESTLRVIWSLRFETRIANAYKARYRKAIPLYIAAYAYGIPTARQRAESASALYARP